MMQIDVVSIFPEMIANASSYGVLGQALSSELLQLNVHTPREFADDRHRTVDDRPFGGGDGMIMLPDPLSKVLRKIKNKANSKKTKIIYMSPQGATLTSKKAQQLSNEEHLVILCGRYGGIDQRIINLYVDEEISIGDYVLSGGELGALVLIDTVSRFIPGVLGHSESALKDSFYDGLLEYPNFTRPREYQSMVVPEILLSGNHKLIEEWKKNISILMTLKKRPDLFKKYMDAENNLYLSNVKKKKESPLKEIKKFFHNIPISDLQVLGLDSIKEEDFDV